MVKQEITEEPEIKPNYNHLRRMSDSRGLLQFSRKAVPDPESGYTVDDNARALMAVLGSNEGEMHRYALRYARFLRAAQRNNGTWCNWWLPGPGFVENLDSQDSHGRAFLACAVGAVSGKKEIETICQTMMVKAMPHLKSLRFLRSQAYALIGCSHLVAHSSPGCREAFKLARHLGEALTDQYYRNHSPGWRWYEDRITYCNAIMPHALFAFGVIHNDRRTLKAARESLLFLSDHLFARGYLNIVGNQGWWVRDLDMPLFDQQPVDVCSLVMASMQAYLTTGAREFLDMANLSYSWYEGNNVHGLSMIDPETGGCYDGLQADGVNTNQGAEAVLSLLLSRQALFRKTRNSCLLAAEGQGRARSGQE